jgi:nucleotide-binding universal stress UspA family protein
LFPQKTFLRILVGLDGSESSLEAADSAISLAKHYGSELIAIHVIPSRTVMGHSSGMFGIAKYSTAYFDIRYHNFPSWYII